MDTAVGLVKAYLELCGYFVLTELPVRARDKRGYHDVTDIDVIAVRFPHQPHPTSGPMVQPLHFLLGTDPQLGTFAEGLDVIIGEVKEAEARINPHLRRRETVAFALRRIGCCPEEIVEEEALCVIRDGQRQHTMAGGLKCRIRLVAFAGRGSSNRKSARFVALDHCARFIQDTLRESQEAVAGAQFKDPVMGVFALQAKLAHFRDSSRLLV